MNIVEGVLNHSRLALAKAITAVENEYDNAVEIMTAIYPHTGNAYVIGITGPPGAGKSTLTDKLAKEYRKRGKTVGIIAIDPTSPFSGGAILGDRIRMLDLTADEGIFVRSMATRGSLGGLSQKAGDAVKLMDAYGFDVIIVETVGVGQSEVDIVKTADTTMVVVIPGMGDDIQAIKAGILEIGDLFTINKADREGTDKLNIEIEMMLELPMHERQRAYFVDLFNAAKPVKIVPAADVLEDYELDYIRHVIKPKPKECYRNSHLLCEAFPERILYCEGKTNVPIPIDHAFNKAGDAYIDITFEFALHENPSIYEYVTFGEYDAKTIRKAVLETGYYGEIYKWLYYQSKK